jgi:N-methylhydantoinase A
LQGLREAFHAATTEVLEALRREQLSGPVQVKRSLAIRYRGQAHHLNVALPDDDVTTTSFFACLERFEREYEALFGRGAAFREAGFEVLYVRAIGTGKLSLPVVPLGRDEFILSGYRQIVFDDPRHPVETPVYSTEYPAPEQYVDGPCVIEYPGQTAVVPPGGKASTDELGNLFVKVGGGAS